jgi:hypothetical protein
MTFIHLWPQTWQARVFLAGVFLFTLLLAFLPLFHRLDYEFALLQGIVLPFLVGWFVLKAQEKKETWLVIGVGLLLPPMMMLGVMLVVKNCNPLQGFMFYVLGPVLGSLFSGSLALFIRERLKVMQMSAFVMAYLGLLLLPVGMAFYFSPQIYFFNHLFGYFAGPIYDRVIELDSRYFFFRLETLFISGLFWMLSFEQGLKNRIHRFSILVGKTSLILAVLIMMLLHESLGISSSHKAIKSKLVRLDDRYEWYGPKDWEPLQTKFTIERLEKEMADLATVFKLANSPRVSIYIYPDVKTKKRLTGAGRTEFTKIWRNEIHITQQGFQRSIRHELAHILFGVYGLPGLGLSTSIGLLEGVAEANETQSLDWTLHEYSAAMMALDLAPKKPEKLLSASGFWTGLGSKSYTLMGSFTRYLIENYGIEPFTQVFASANFQDVYQKSPQELIAEWQAFLAQTKISPSLARAARYRFERKSIFQTQCPHTVAQALEYGFEAIEQEDYIKAMVFFNEALTYTDHKSPDAIYGLIKARLFNAAISPKVSFQDARLVSDSLAALLEKPWAAQFLISNTASWYKGSVGNKDAAQLDSLLSRQLSFGYDVAILKRQEAHRLEIPMDVFSELMPKQEKVTLIQKELSQDNPPRRRALLKLLLAEHFYKNYKYLNVSELLESIPAFEQQSLEFRRLMILFNAVLKTNQHKKVYVVAAQAKRMALKMRGARAKTDWIQNQLKLYNYE